VLVFRAVQSLLANIREHAQATSAKVTVDLDANQIRVSVEDNGQGMDTEVVLAEEAPGRGLKRLVERIEQAGGDVEIESKPGGGTRIAFALPTD
jgi:signal transduction histidine kinase